MTDRRSAAPGWTLRRLAALLTAKNVLDREMAEIIGKPMEKGNFGEFVAGQIFDIELHESGAHEGSDGVFRSGELAGQSVNIKYSGKHDGTLNMKKRKGPDHYLVMTGPKDAADSRPWVIESVFLFEAKDLLRRLTVQIGTATSVRKELWDEAEIYPDDSVSPLTLTRRERNLLALFSAPAIG